MLHLWMKAHSWILVGKLSRTAISIIHVACSINKKSKFGATLEFGYMVKTLALRKKQKGWRATPTPTPHPHAHQHAHHHHHLNNTWLITFLWMQLINSLSMLLLKIKAKNKIHDHSPCLIWCSIAKQNISFLPRKSPWISNTNCLTMIFIKLE